MNYYFFATMYSNEEGVMQGGYTVRVTVKHMKPEERIQFERDFPYAIEPIPATPNTNK